MAKRTQKPIKSVTKKPAKPAAKPPVIKPVAAKAEPKKVPAWRVGLLWLQTSPWLARWFALASLGVLLTTSALWTAYGARLHQGNADQLVDGYLFSDVSTLQQAVFPGTHTFLLKWPVFIVMGLAGNTQDVYLAATMLLVLLTVGGFAYLLWRIERRALPFGLLCLALASCLLLIPAQPAPGVLLPVNMAMSTTRNLEYLFLLAAAAWTMQAKGWRDKRLLLVLAGLTILLASDKIYLPLAIGGGLIFIAHAMIQRRNYKPARRGVQWLLGVVLGAIGSVILLWLIQLAGITHIAQQSTASPYALIGSLKQLAVAISYAILDILTNFGANPAPAQDVLPSVPGAIWQGITSSRGLPTILNGLIMLLAFSALYKMLHRPAQTIAHRLSVLVGGMAAASIAVFVLTKHYYPADARYLSLILFAAFVALATASRQYLLRPRWAGATALLLLIGIGVGVRTASADTATAQAAASNRTALTEQVADALAANHINYLAGDYWRVMPVKATAKRSVTAWPLYPCAQRPPSLTSDAWNPPAGQPTAYLAVQDASEFTYDGCSLSQIIAAYGVPTRRVLVSVPSGSLALLLVYDRGLNAASLHVPAPAASSTGPQPLKSLRDDALCYGGVSLNVVAHEDDDLLFMNPDIAKAIHDKGCMRTVFLTAGNAGAGPSYWLGRERGAQAAYASLFNAPDDWLLTQEVVQGQAVSTYRLKDVPEIALTFLHIPDGNLKGDGFSANHNQSLERLLNGRIRHIDSLDGSISYTRDSLVAAIQDFIHSDRPDLIRAQGYEPGGQPGDHSDHIAAGRFAEMAWRTTEPKAAFLAYAGYTERYLLPNLSAEETEAKTALFFTYGKSDAAVCQSKEECYRNTMYGAFLVRQYNQELKH